MVGAPYRAAHGVHDTPAALDRRVLVCSVSRIWPGLAAGQSPRLHPMTISPAVLQYGPRQPRVTPARSSTPLRREPALELCPCQRRAGCMQDVDQNGGDVSVPCVTRLLQLWLGTCPWRLQGLAPLLVDMCLTAPLPPQRRVQGGGPQGSASRRHGWLHRALVRARSAFHPTQASRWPSGGQQPACALLAAVYSHSWLPPPGHSHGHCGISHTSPLFP